jgi:hypothetical protein
VLPPVEIGEDLKRVAALFNDALPGRERADDEQLAGS